MEARTRWNESSKRSDNHRRREAGEEFGKDRLRALLRDNAHRTAEEITRAVRDGVQAFCGEARQLDDITFVIARHVEPGAR
jgi:serine phosphatase RsbU (regulator of sigma subunit)